MVYCDMCVIKFIYMLDVDWIIIKGGREFMVKINGEILS